MQMKKLILIISSLLLFGICACTPSTPSNFLQGTREITLSNGMRFLLLRRSGAPVFNAYIVVRVGGIDEAEGQTGIAHLLEHMAFKGTSRIGSKDFAAEQKLLDRIEELHARLLKAQGPEQARLAEEMRAQIEAAGRFVEKEEFSKIYLRNGGAGLNATTSQDITSYFVELPNTKLPLWAYLESERLRDPVFREFYLERDVVLEERRTRVDDSPFGKLYESLMELAFEKSPYRRPTVGYARDVARLSATDLRNFYKKYYVPSNMVGVVVGDIDLDETAKILEKYFGKIPPGPRPPQPQAETLRPSEEKRVEVPFDAAPALMSGYPKPTMPNPEDYVFDVLDQVLCEGRTSRLYRRLVEQDRLANNVRCSSSTPGARLDNLFFFYVSIAEGKSAEEVLQAVDEELQKVLAQGIGKPELNKAKKNLLADWNYELQGNENTAQMLSYFEAVTGNWKYLVEHPRHIQAVTSKDLQGVVKNYLNPGQRSTVVLKKISAADAK
ncbi:MAG TPA: insulinase family protein [Deltaproteobacteria bacterium]|nr:insulinase family protein [Deltaproteobacteria bacterium]